MITRCRVWLRLHLHSSLMSIKETILGVSPLKFFIVTSLIFGTTFLLIIPPFQGGDEPLHFYRAYQISQSNLMVDKNIGNDYGGLLPSSLQETVALTTNNSSLGNLQINEKYRIRTTKQALLIKEKPTDTQWTNFTATALYPPIAYAPQASGVLVARTLKMPPILMLYFGRFANLLAWIILIAISIKLIPFKKWAIVFVGLLPVALSQASSLSADVMTIGLFAVFLSAIFYLIDRDKLISKFELTNLVVLMSAIALCKQIMIVVLPLIFLIPRRLFMSKKSSYIWKILLIIIPLIVYALWIYVIKNVDLKSVFSHNQNPALQIQFMIYHPLRFIKVIWDTFFFSQGDAITHSFIGTFGWGDVKLSEAFIVLGYTGLFLVLVMNPYARAKDIISNHQRTIALIVFAAYGLAVSAALYAYYNPVASKVINGLQGRYFLPLALIAIPILNSTWMKSSKLAYKNIAIFVPIILLVASTITIYFRYYVQG